LQRPAGRDAPQRRRCLAHDVVDGIGGMSDFRPPSISRRFVPVWRRHFLVWRKLAIPSILGNLADPMIYMLGLGYGIGTLMPEVAGVPYITFLAAGAACFSTMNSATFETLYSAFSRMQVQRTWDAILNAPVALDDVMLAELAWAASKSCLSGTAILAVVWLLGLAPLSLLALWALPLIFLVGLTFSAMGLVMTALAPSYDFFMYYFTLLVTPMTLLSGVFFPVEQLPGVFQTVSALLPLSHAVGLVRPLLLGHLPADIGLHIAVLAGYAIAAFWLALGLARRRLLR
jgi:lipooligosaccharide transport system permease protein